MRPDDDPDGVAARLGGLIDRVVLVPVKAFGEAKRRLSPLLDVAHRAELARELAATVLAAAHDLPTAVVCDDDDVAAWASDHGSLVIHAPGMGLNGAVAFGVGTLRYAGARSVIVAHADLPLATDLRWVGAYDGITLVPDRCEDGTNVICVPTAIEFPFSYGPRSFRRHHGAALRSGLPVRVCPDAALSLDLDTPEDLLLVERLRHGGTTVPPR